MREKYILVDCTRKIIVKRGMAKVCRARMETLYQMAKMAGKDAEWGTKDYCTANGKSYKVALANNDKYAKYEDITITDALLAKDGCF